jgi:putative Mg2+ transporter-C (MgtC) family protein
MAMGGLGIGDVVLRLSVATVFGMLVGIDRERRERAAGIRTMSLVGLGAALFTLSSAYGLDSLAAAQHLPLDPSRIAAQIVSGIGFLGAGVIFLRRDAVRGLTTAAALWVVAAIGMACGAGFWAAGITGIVLALVVLAVMRPVERMIFPQHGPHQVLIHADSVDAAGDAIPRVRAILEQSDVQMDRLTLRPAKRGGELIAVRCRIKRPDDLAQAMRLLRAIPGVSSVQADIRVATPDSDEDENQD